MQYFLGTTFFTSLIIKKAPGSASSAAVFIVLYFFLPLSILATALALIILTCCHVYSFPFFAKKFGNEDPSVYTLDETIAIVVMGYFIRGIEAWVVSFVLYRFFDIVKPLGIKAFEKNTMLSSSIRNVGDDLIAALYTLLLVKSYGFFFS